MKRLAWMIPFVAVLACMAGLAACTDEETFDEPADRARLAKMETEIDDLIGEPTCKDGKECRVMAFGAKPCGGPWSFKVFSVSSVDSTALADLVDDYNIYNRTLNDRYGWSSDCTVVMPPNVDCVEGRCVVVE